MQDGNGARNEGRAEGMDVKHDEGGPSSHRRSRSGGILGAFLRSSIDAMGKTPPTQIGNDEQEQEQDAEGAKRASSLATALRQNQGRQRKGSLRKAAMAKMRERSTSLRKAKTPTITTTMSLDPSDEATASGRFSYENAPLNSSSDSGWLPATQLSPSSPALIYTPPDGPGRPAPSLLASPMTSPVAPYASTTDEDDSMSFYRPSAAGNDFSFSAANQGSVTSLAHRRSTRSNRRTSISAVLTPAEADPDDEWDYSETEWWGWVVLIATWIVFVVGMGSCLGIWSWAWDVGETPYAPPDLEDDATLPITGYYPALIVCTAVTSWVWVVVAWVGMKYFRHAKVGVDG
jgi:hypothetical protein